MIYIVLLIIASFIVGLSVGGWFMIGHYEKERCNYESFNKKKQKKSLVQRVPPTVEKRN